MAMSPLQELVSHRATLMPLTLDQYHRMLETGILKDGDPYELLDGYLVRKDRSKAGADPMTIGPDHTGGVKLLGEIGNDLKRYGCHIALQQPISILPDSEPEPDGSVLRGAISDYFGRHPAPSEILCIFEVSDSSLERDRVTKQRIYVDAGVEQYVIVNLIDWVVEVYAKPQRGRGKYEEVTVRRPGEKFRVVLDGGAFLDIAVDAVLPRKR